MAFWDQPKRKRTSSKDSMTTREYRLFKKRERRKKPSWYENMAHNSGRIMKLSLGEDIKKEIEQAIDFTGLRVKAEEVMSLFVLSIMVFVVFSISLAVTGVIPLIGAILLPFVGFLVGYYLLRYPTYKMKELRVKASSQVILAILYMVVSMRISPNLERAFRFAAANITGPLAWDMRKLVWDLEMRKYNSVREAMDDYISKWKPENEEFAEALRLIRDSTSHSPERAKNVLDQALNKVLEGSKTRMKHYVQDLKLPVMMIHMMGIVLPVLGSIMAPLVAVFMADLARWWHFVLGYNVILPIIILWFINSTLGKRPVTLSYAKLEKHPFMRKGNAPIIFLSLLILLGFVIYPVYYFSQNPTLLLEGIKGRELGVLPMSMSALIILGAAVSLSVYFLVANSKKMKLQKEINSIEEEFELALFQLGNRISGGTPTEVAVEKSLDDVKDLKIAGLFRRTLRNMKTLGLTFESALFDDRFGALRYYPSKLLRSIMRAVVDTAKKGISYAAESMFRIANYLKNIRETQEYIRDLLEETISSMKFQAYFLTPMVGGLVVSMADIIITVLGKLGTYLDELNLAGKYGEQFGLSNFTQIFGNVDASMSPEVFQFIVGTYLIQVIIILAIFITKISEGENKTIQWYRAGKMLLVGVTLYFLILLTSVSIFHSFIESALSNLGMV